MRSSTIFKVQVVLSPKTACQWCWHAEVLNLWPAMPRHGSTCCKHVAQALHTVHVHKGLLITHHHNSCDWMQCTSAYWCCSSCCIFTKRQHHGASGSCSNWSPDGVCQLWSTGPAARHCAYIGGALQAATDNHKDLNKPCTFPNWKPLVHLQQILVFSKLGDHQSKGRPSKPKLRLSPN